MKRPAGLLCVAVIAVAGCASTGSNGSVLYASGTPSVYGSWEFIGATAETVAGAPRVTFQPEGIAYLLWSFNRVWDGSARLELSITAGQDTTVGVAVCDDHDSWALRTQRVKAGPAKVVFPVGDMVRDGVQLAFMKKVVVWTDAEGQGATLTLGRLELAGSADGAKMQRNWMTLCNAADPLSVYLWEGRSVGKSEIVRDHATIREHSMKLRFSDEKYTSAYGRIPPDWRGYRTLAMDIFNPTDNDIRLLVAVRPAWFLYKDKPEALRLATLRPGANRVVCDLRQMAAEVEAQTKTKFDFSTIQNFPLHLVGFKGTVHLFFGDIHLEGENAVRPADPPAFMRKSHEAQWYQKFGRTDFAPVSRPLTPEELSGVKDVLLTDLSKIKPGELWAGVAKINITPQVPVSLAGGALPRGESVLSDLYARAVVLSDGKTTAGFVTLDMLAGFSPMADVGRSMGARLIGMTDNSSIFIWATHNHSGPVAWGPIGERGVKKDLTGKIASAIVRARQNMQPVYLVGAKGKFDFNFNRRYIGPGGKAGGYLWDRYLERQWDQLPADKELGVVDLRDANDRTVATLAMYSGHANMNCMVSETVNADWPGVLCTSLERETGAPAILINGSFGDVDMKGNAVSPERTVVTGAGVARAVELLLQDAKPLDATPLKVGRKSRKAPPFGGKPGSTITVGALTFGDVALAQPPGELYTGLGMQTKQRSPYPFTFTAFGAGGYLPTRQSVKEGGYGSEGRSPDWGEIARDLMVELLKEMRRP